MQYQSPIYLELIMQSHTGIKLCRFFLIILFSLTPLSSQAVEEITFTGGQPLNQYVPSIIIPVLTEAFKRNGIRFKAVHHPSLRSLVYSSTGALDGELHRVYGFPSASGGKYPDLIRIESELLTTWLAIYATKQITFDSWEDLKEHKVSYSLGKKVLDNILSQLLPKEQILVANSDTQAFKMLSGGLVNVVIAGSRTGVDLLEAHSQFSNIKKVKNVHPIRMYSYIHKKHKQLAVKIADTIEQMKKDGSYAKIVESVINFSNL
jgi:polar amino acid transport system substrate-binding protein